MCTKQQTLLSCFLQSIATEYARTDMPNTSMVLAASGQACNYYYYYCNFHKIIQLFLKMTALTKVQQEYGNWVSQPFVKLHQMYHLMTKKR